MVTDEKLVKDFEHRSHVNGFSQECDLRCQTGVNTIADESFCNFDENEKRKGLFKPIKLIKK